MGGELGRAVWHRRWPRRRVPHRGAAKVSTLLPREGGGAQVFHLRRHEIYVLNGLGKMLTAVLEAVPGQPLPLEGVAP